MSAEEPQVPPRAEAEKTQPVPTPEPPSFVKGADMKSDMAEMPPVSAAGLREKIHAKLGPGASVALTVFLFLLVVALVCALAPKSQPEAADPDALGVEANLDGAAGNLASAYPEDMERTSLEDLPPVTPELTAYQNANDARRVSDLTALANLAAVYYMDQKADLPLSKDYIRLDEENPVAAFLLDAIRRYGKNESLLRDPLAPDFYYAYRSLDGKNIEFSARLEDVGADYCTGQSVCLLHKALTEADILAIGSHLELYR